MAPARIEDRDRNWRGSKLGQYLDEPSGCNVIGDVIGGNLNQPVPVQSPRNITLSVVDAEMALHGNGDLTPVLEPIPARREGGHAQRVVDQMMFREIGRRLWHPEFREILRPGAGQHRHITDLAADQFAVLQNGQTHHRVDPFRDQINHSVGGADLQRHRRVSGAKVLQVRNDKTPCDPAWHVDPQAPRNVIGTEAKLSFGLPERIDQITGGVGKLQSFLRWTHHPCGTLKKLHAEAVLQRLHRAGHGRARQAEHLRCAGEVPAVHDLNEHLHLLNSIHAYCSPFLAGNVKNGLII